MAAETPATSGGGSEAVANRLSILNRKMDEAAAAQSRSKNVGRLMTFLIVVAAIIGVWVLISPFRTAWANREDYQVAFEVELKDSILPKLREELESKEFQTVLKGVADSALEELKQRDEEVYAAVDTEVKAFVENITTWGEEQLVSRRTGLQDYVTSRVQAVAPELQDENTAELVLANASMAMDNAVNSIVEKYLQGHMNNLISIGDQIQQFPVPEDIAAMGDEELSNALVEELGAYSMSIFQTSLSPESRDFLRQVGGENE